MNVIIILEDMVLLYQAHVLSGSHMYCSSMKEFIAQLLYSKSNCTTPLTLVPLLENFQRHHEGNIEDQVQTQCCHGKDHGATAVKPQSKEDGQS